MIVRCGEKGAIGEHLSTYANSVAGTKARHCFNGDGGKRKLYGGERERDGETERDREIERQRHKERQREVKRRRGREKERDRE